MRIIPWLIVGLSATLLAGCGSYDPIDRTIVSSKVLRSTDAFNPTISTRSEDSFIGFSYDPKKKEFLIVGEKYSYIAPVAKKVQFIIDTPAIRDNIRVRYRDEKGWGGWNYKLVDKNGIPLEKPELSDLTLIMCFNNTVPQSQIDEYKRTFESSRIYFTIFLKEPCFYLPLGDSRAQMFTTTPESKRAIKTKLPRPFPYLIDTVTAKDKATLESQNRKAKALSPLATVADGLLTFGQYLALPFTIWH